MTEKKIKLNSESYASVKAMLESPDEENRVMGFECIENSDLRNGLVYILFLLKEANVPDTEWMDHAKRTVAFLKTLVSSGLTFRTIIKKLREYQVDSASYEFFIERYGEYIRNTVNKEYGGELISSLEITVKINNAHESRTTGESL
jgi:hypothetical protein